MRYGTGGKRKKKGTISEEEEEEEEKVILLCWTVYRIVELTRPCVDTARVPAYYYNIV